MVNLLGYMMMLQDQKVRRKNSKSPTVAELTKLVAEGKVQFKSSYHEKIAIGITLVILVLGYVWGMATQPFNFARSGSLIIITGIIFAALDLAGRLTLVDKWVIARVEETGPAAIADPARKNRDKAYREIKRQEIAEDAITRRIQVATDKARMRLRFVEVSILILGTLIYGFGDLIVVHWRF
ncbi:MAG: hypothetical protein ACYCVU_06770 [Gammaproteobacteria bacterium]